MNDARGSSFGWGVMPVGVHWSWNVWYGGNSATGFANTQEQAQFLATLALDKLRQDFPQKEKNAP